MPADDPVTRALLPRSDSIFMISLVNMRLQDATVANVQTQPKTIAAQNVPYKAKGPELRADAVRICP